MSIDQHLAMNFSVNNRIMPLEIINIIKSFAFQDKTVAFIKRKKREIVEQFEKAIYSRKNRCKWVNDDSETWLFMFAYQRFPMQSTNCSYCGNYFRVINNKLLCRCTTHNAPQFIGWIE
jgi:hypothetical protein